MLLLETKLIVVPMYNDTSNIATDVPQSKIRYYYVDQKAQQWGYWSPVRSVARLSVQLGDPG